jgi:hypothetical protein
MASLFHATGSHLASCDVPAQHQRDAVRCTHQVGAMNSHETSATSHSLWIKPQADGRKGLFKTGRRGFLSMARRRIRSVIFKQKSIGGKNPFRKLQGQRRSAVRKRGIECFYKAMCE